MRHLIRLFRPAQPTHRPWTLTPDQHQQLLFLLSDVGLRIVAEARGPVPLLTFGRRFLEHLGHRPHSIPPEHFADALKTVIKEMRDDRLTILSPTDFPGVGYVFNSLDPETHPLRSSR